MYIYFFIINRFLVGDCTYFRKMLPYMLAVLGIKHFV